MNLMKYRTYFLYSESTEQISVEFDIRAPALIVSAADFNIVSCRGGTSKENNGL
jgi:hypothetical protein